MPLNDLSDLHKIKSVKKAQLILFDVSHILTSKFMLLLSGHRYTHIIKYCFKYDG